MIVLLTVYVLLESGRGSGEMAARDCRLNRTSADYVHYIGAQYAVLECARDVTRRTIEVNNGNNSGSCKTTEDLVPKIETFINVSVACGALDESGANTLSRLATYITPFAFARMKREYLTGIHSRQKEIDACKNETHVVGTAAFEGDILQHPLIFNKVGCRQSQALETCVSEALDGLHVEGLVRYVSELFRGVRELGRCACEAPQQDACGSTDAGRVAIAASLGSVALVVLLVSAAAFVVVRRRLRRCHLRCDVVDGYALSNIDTKNRAR